MKKNNRYLTKTRFNLASECPTKLFYTGKKEFTNKKNDDDFLLALAEGGFQVGELAKYYHPGGYSVDSLDINQAINKTKKLLLNDKVIIYEAAFQFSHYLIRVDVLVKNGNNIELIEVKAKSFKSFDKFYNASGFISTSWLPYLNDVAFQLWVMQQAYPEFLITPYLMLADKNKKTSINGLNQFFKIKKDNNRKRVIVDNALDIHQLGEKILIKIDVGDFVQMIYDGKSNKKADLSKNFIDRIEEYGKYYNDNQRYPISLGLHCKKCEFKDDSDIEKSGYFTCWNNTFPQFNPQTPHVFDIWNYRKSQKIIDFGLYAMKDVYSSEFVDTLNDRQYLQVDKTVNNSIDEDIKPELFNEMQKWEFPLHFIDFETCMIAIPFHKGRAPYEQIAFQFSCHTLYKNGEIKHHEWIESDANNFPNYQFVRELKKILDNDNGSIFRYSAHENTVLLQIKAQMIVEDELKYKNLINWIDNITYRKDIETKKKIEGSRNMIDLLEYVKKYYYHPQMRGSNSLKYVLPAIFSTSEFIKNKYSKELDFGTNLKDFILWKIDKYNNKVCSPYQLLENKYKKININEDNLYFLDEKIEDGSAAMLAYSKLQFTDMLDQEREALTNALLQYCELDTLAMLMIYEHWNSIR